MSHLSHINSLVKTLSRLGFGNIAVVAAYRLAATRGYLDPDVAPLPCEQFFTLDSTGIRTVACSSPALLTEAKELSEGFMRPFGGEKIDLGSPPDWLRNVISNAKGKADQAWWRTEDFDPAFGDIKGVWEASRSDWAVVFARAAIANGDAAFVSQLNTWLTDWIVTNPAFFGPNWKCGQETSIRVLQILLAARILDQDRSPTAALIAFVNLHVRRIALTRFYANAQNNNHATSEAAALFVAGSWLGVVSTGDVQRRGLHWAKVGRTWIEKLVQRLIFSDGGFSQYSVNYHRMLLDTLCQVEAWRQRLGAPRFSDSFYTQAARAARWLAALVSSVTGDAPNLGANDGARVFRLHSLPYRDYRPSVQLATTIFCGRATYKAGPWDEPSMWLEIEHAKLDSALSIKRSQSFPEFGLVILNAKHDGSGPYAFVRVPRSKFRPSQADPLHFDLWGADGVNLLRDAGTFSYFDNDAIEYFSGIAAHNTIAFDDHEPMERLTRFLFADWIEGKDSSPTMSGDNISWHGAYHDRFGVHHHRRIESDGNLWTVTDDIDGFKKKAILRWRLAPGMARLTAQGVEHERFNITVEANVPERFLRLAQGWESRLYGRKEPVHVLEVEFGQGVRRIRTDIRVW